MKEVFIDRLQEKHLPEVLEIERASFSDPWSSQSFLLEIANPMAYSLVAVKSTRVVGYVVSRKVLDEGYIFKLAVLEEHRRQGIASKLTEAALTWLRGEKCRQVWLEVRASNFSARKFYSLFGFREQNVRKHYYGPGGEDAVVMSLKL